MKKFLSIVAILCTLLVFGENKLAKGRWVANNSGSSGKAVKKADNSCCQKP